QAVDLAIGMDADVLDVHARLPHRDGTLDLEGDLADRRLLDRGEDKVVDAAPELGAQRSLAGGGRDDDADGLVELLVALDHRDGPGGVGAERERQPAPNEGGMRSHVSLR